MIKLPAALCTALMSLSAVCAAQGYPAKPIRWIVPFPPGGGTDFYARLLGSKVSETWKQQIVIDNRGGAGGIVGTEIAAHLASQGAVPRHTTPEGFTRFINDDRERLQKVIRAAGVKAE